jgi:hypothetical protein
MQPLHLDNTMPALFSLALGNGSTSDQAEDAESHLQCGYGACSKCNCRAYEGNDSTCANRGCGHAFQDHW